MNLTVASFFSGIGLLDLGLEWAGWRTVSFSEINPYASRVLGLRFPGVPNLGDIHAIESVPDATLWAGGFPCQPISNAGKRLAQADDRWLWPAWARLIRQFRPRYLLLENVAALLGRGLGDVLGDLAALGYDAEWDCIPAAALGAPHRRDRIWILAYATCDGRAISGTGNEGRDADAPSSQSVRRQSLRTGADGRTQPEALADTARVGRQPWRAGDATQEPGGWEPGGSRVRTDIMADTDCQGPQGHRGLCIYGDGAGERLARSRSRSQQGWWQSEPALGRVAHGVPHRVDRLRCLGNGVVPQVTEWIGERLAAHLAA